LLLGEIEKASLTVIIIIEHAAYQEISEPIPQNFTYPSRMPSDSLAGGRSRWRK
jgi:hypothetical protein